MDAANFKFDHARGPIYGFISEQGLQSLLLPRADHPAEPYLLHSAPNIVRGRILHKALENYFAGIAETFDRIELDLDGGTAFQRAVWQALREMCWGETCTYGELARRIGAGPRAARAIGQALGANPAPIVIPCHRVLAAGGRLGGFSAGLEWKRDLLELEGVDVG
jgi:O-6-methylguanine DNA methyltransferase